jgi:hypothetical protein
MLPDEALRLETRQFTAWNLNLLLAVFLLTVIQVLVGKVRNLPLWLAKIPIISDPEGQGFQWLLILLALLPLAMTMALLWKTKQVILDSVFGAQR